MEAVGNTTTSAPIPVGGSGRAHSLRAMVICLGAAALILVIPLVSQIFLYATVAALGACWALPLWLDWQRGRFDLFAPIHVFGGIYFIYFGVGAVWTVQNPDRVAYDLQITPFVPRAAFYCLLGYLALLAGYYLPWRRRELTSRMEEWPRGPVLMTVVGALGLAGYIALALWTRASWVGASLPGVVSSVGQLSPLFLQAWALAWLLWFSKQGGVGARMVLFGLFVPGAAFVAYLTVSTKSLLMVLLGVPAISYYYARRRVPWRVLAGLALLLVFVVFPFYNTFRWQDPNLSQTERLERTYQTVQGWQSETYQMFSLGTFQRRMAMINSVAVVVRDVGRWVPYAKGETLFDPLLMGLIPRFVWPDKPESVGGRDFGRRFRVTNFFSRKTFISPTIPGELYWNFDLPGVVVGMALLGAGMRWAYRRYSESRLTDPIRRSIGIVILVQVALLGGSLAPGLIGIVRPLVLMEILRWFGRRYGLIQYR